MNNYLRKYFIMGSQNCIRDPIQTLHEAIRGGITAFQYREKGANALIGESKISLGKKLRKICRDNHIPFYINDDVHLIDVLDVDGIHVGQEDTNVKTIRTRHPNILIGLSISNEEELNKSPLHLIDYIGAGPTFTTFTKDDAKKAVGTKWIKTLKNKVPDLPIVAIGGINVDNAAEVIGAGADGLAVISTITQAHNIVQTVQQL